MANIPNPADFIYSTTERAHTGFQFVTVKDTETESRAMTIVASSEHSWGSHKAWVASRYSRSAESAIELASQITTAGTDTDKKLASVFHGYGHASVADMAQMMVYIENVPDTYAVRLYNESSIGGGQHRSTRYQDFRGIQAVPLGYYMRLPFLNGTVNPNTIDLNTFARLDRAFQDVQTTGINFYEKYVGLLTQAYISTYNIENPNLAERQALSARVFDSARYFLPNGTCLQTSFAWETSAREWARIISTFKVSTDPYLERLGYQIEALLAPDKDIAKSIGYLPEAAELIRHTKGDETTANNLETLHQFLESTNFLKGAIYDNGGGFRETEVVELYTEMPGDIMAVMQYILTLYPNLDEKWLLEKLENIDDSTADQIGKILFSNFNQHRQMGVQARTNTHNYLLRLGIGEARDLNRHRAFGRFLSFLSSETNYHTHILEGYTLPAYLTDNPLLAEIRKGFEADMVMYFEQIRRFNEMAMQESWFPHHVLVQLLPMGTSVRMWMHGSTKEGSYITSLREGEGGHINYRKLAYEMALRLSKSGRFSAALALMPNRKPDASSREQFLSRK